MLANFFPFGKNNENHRRTLKVGNKLYKNEETFYQEALYALCGLESHEGCRHRL